MGTHYQWDSIASPHASEDRARHHSRSHRRLHHEHDRQPLRTRSADEIDATIGKKRRMNVIGRQRGTTIQG
jgi:hypothetical protein